jgi:hypothetical protein
MLLTLKTNVKAYYWTFITGLLFLPKLSFADDDPFPSISTNGDVMQTAGTSMETALKYLLIGAGGLLILICLGILVHRMRDDSRDKDHGNLIMTFILLALGMTLGFVLIGIGWTAFSAQIQS